MIFYQARMLSTVVSRSLQPPMGAFESSVRHLRAWPWLCDSNLHMNNGSYLKVMDFGRSEWLGAVGGGPVAFMDGLYFVLGGVNVTFRRAIDVMQPYTLHTTLHSFDERWFYVVQEFRLQDGRVAARALVRGQARDTNGAVAVSTLLARAGMEVDSPLMSDEFRHWLAAMDESLAAVKALDAKRG